jgi:hypothetical protein
LFDIFLLQISVQSHQVINNWRKELTTLNPSTAAATATDKGLQKVNRIIKIET